MRYICDSKCLPYIYGEYPLLELFEKCLKSVEKLFEKCLTEMDEGVFVQRLEIFVLFYLVIEGMRGRLILCSLAC